MKVDEIHNILIEDVVTSVTKVYVTKKTEEEHKTVIAEFIVGLEDGSWERKHER